MNEKGIVKLDLQVRKTDNGYVVGIISRGTDWGSGSTSEHIFFTLEEVSEFLTAELGGLEEQFEPLKITG